MISGRSVAAGGPRHSSVSRAVACGSVHTWSRGAIAGLQQQGPGQTRTDGIADMLVGPLPDAENRGSDRNRSGDFTYRGSGEGVNVQHV